MSMSRLAALAQSVSSKFRRTDWDGLAKKWAFRGLAVRLLLDVRDMYAQHKPHRS